MSNREEIIERISEGIVGARVSHASGKRGTAVGADGAYLTVRFDDGSESEFQFPSALERGWLSFEDDRVMKAVAEWKSLKESEEGAFKARMAELSKKAEERDRIRTSSLEAKKKAEADAKKAMREKAKKDAAEKRFETMLRVAKQAGKGIWDEDVALGWLARHVTHIDASMPDFMEARFESEFGKQEHSTVDSDRKTSGGFPMRWAFSGKVSVDETDDMPPSLQRVFKGEKTACDSAFALALVRDHGFSFGKKQNANEVRKLAGDKKAFEVGYGKKIC